MSDTAMSGSVRRDSEVADRQNRHRGNRLGAPLLLDRQWHKQQAEHDERDLHGKGYQCDLQALAEHDQGAHVYPLASGHWRVDRLNIEFGLTQRSRHRAARYVQDLRPWTVDRRQSFDLRHQTADEKRDRQAKEQRDDEGDRLPIERRHDLPGVALQEREGDEDHQQRQRPRQQPANAADLRSRPPKRPAQRAKDAEGCSDVNGGQEQRASSMTT